MTERYKYKGDNGLIEWPLLQRDGTPLNVADLTLLYVEFIQNERVKKKYIFLQGDKPVDPEIREGEEPNIVEIEYTTELTESLDDCKTYVKLTLEVEDPSLLVDNELHAEFVRYAFTII